MTNDEMRTRIVERMQRRMRVGWFDHSADSYDMRVATARAWRIYLRVCKGMRVSLLEALHG